MPLFVQITENCKDSAQRHGVLAEVQKLAKRVEETQSTSSFDKFPIPYIVKKKLKKRQHRLIAKTTELDGQVIVSFLEVMIRGDHNYDSSSGFGKDPDGYGQRNFESLLTDEDLRKFLDSRAVAPPQDLPEPSEAEFNLLFSAFSQSEDSSSDAIVYETEQWISAICNETRRPFLGMIASAVLHAFEGANGLRTASVPNRPGWQVAYFRNEAGLLLLDFATNSTELETSEAVRKIRTLQAANSEIDIQRFARRAYPGLILADEELWVEVEQEQQANMALSPEESDVLRSATDPNNPFPLFINGRAGSGKSTILQYIYAKFSEKYLGLTSEERAQVAAPIYLTANAELVRIAKDRVERLLRKDVTVGAQNHAELGKLLSDGFNDFQSYELSLLTPIDRRNRFALAKRVTYSSFRNRWRTKFGQQPDAYRNFGPELSWHVIRTYIKGTSPDDILDADDFAQLPEAHRSVSLDTYKEIYERVWKGWYEPLCDDEGLWDDQDLALYVLQNDLAVARHPAVFCDEAQDFTRIELELLLRINLFSNRRVPPEHLGRVCFVFAGDQFQTLNPTGFRWEAIKASFVEKFVQEMDYGRKRRIDLNYRELQFNYRSTEKIVRFSNSVQAYRAATFDLANLKPQLPWGQGPAAFGVEFFGAKDGDFWRYFKDMRGVVVIVPCAEGDERAYVEQDPALKASIPMIEGVPLNVFSANRAKGCEYQATIVYGFGQYFDQHVDSDFGESDSEKRRELMLPLEYFINRLYVAVSRPKARLLVVDSTASFDALWRFATATDGFEKLWQQWPRGRDIWPTVVERMTRGIHQNLRDATSVDLAELARNYRAEGKARRDPYYLRQAAQTFHAVGDAAAQAECNALALEFEDRFAESAREYQGAGLARDAVRMFWRAGRTAWGELANMAIASPQVASMVEVKVANALAAPKDSVRLRDALDAIKAGVTDPERADLFVGVPEWSIATEALASTWLTNRADIAPTLTAKALHASIKRLRGDGIDASAPTYARVCEAAEAWEEAVEAFVRANMTSDPGYMNAVSKSAAYPANLRHLAKQQAYTAIVEVFKANAGTRLSLDDAVIVFDGFRSIGDTNAAIELGWEYALSAPLSKLLMDDTHLADAARTAALHGMLRGFLERREWSCIAFIANPGPKAAAELAQRGLIWKPEDNLVLKGLLVREWARQGNLADVPDNIKPALQKMLSGFGQSFLQGANRTGHSLAEVGAAIERGERFNDAKVFYGDVRTPPFSSDEKAFARLRLVAVRNRYLKELLVTRGESGTSNQLKREINQELAALKLKSVDAVPSFPELRPIAFDYGIGNRLGDTEVDAEESNKDGHEPSADGAVQVATSKGDMSSFRPVEKISVNDFDLVYSRTGQRLNITHRESLQTAYLLVPTGQVGGEKDFEATSGGFYCADWSVRVAIAQHEEDRLIEVILGGVLVRIAGV